MSLAALLLLAVGAADLVRWTPAAVGRTRTGLAAAVGAAVAVAAALLLVDGAAARLALGAAGVVVVVAWLALDGPAATRSPRRTALPLALAAAVVVAVVALTGPVPPAGGALGRWYAHVAPGALAGTSATALGASSTSPLPTVLRVHGAGAPLAVPLVAVAGGVFLLASANRVVRLVLAAAGTVPSAGEAALRGGRLLGPLERVFILSLALGGDLTAAAVVIAAKAVLRLPEIRSARAQRSGAPDVVTEYFLVGTFTSWLLAVAVAGLAALAR